MAASGAYFSLLDGVRMVDGRLNNLFSDGTVGQGVTYAFFEVRNIGNGLLTGGKVWLVLDPDGGSFTIAKGASSGEAPTAGASEAWTLPTPATLSFSAPASEAAGLTLPNLAPGQKALYCASRDLSSATSKRPEVNRLFGSGTVPLGF